MFTKDNIDLMGCEYFRTYRDLKSKEERKDN